MLSPEEPSAHNQKATEPRLHAPGPANLSSQQNGDNTTEFTEEFLYGLNKTTYVNTCLVHAMCSARDRTIC